MQLLIACMKICPYRVATRKLFYYMLIENSISINDYDITILRTIYLQTNPQVVLLDGDYTIDDELTLFTVPSIEKHYSSANDAFYTDAGVDAFSHEQNLMILSNTNVLIMGCGHAGAVNILERAMVYKPQVWAAITYGTH